MLEVATPERSELNRLGEQAAQYARSSKAANTVRAYRSDWHDFRVWCAAHARSPLPASPDTIAMYLADRVAMANVSTLRRRMSAIAQAHRLAGLESPTTDPVVTTVWRGICRTHGSAQRGKAPLLAQELRTAVEALRHDVKGRRDRALLLVGFASALRRSELVALDVEDVAYVDDGMVLAIRRSKTDQVGDGRTVGVPFGRRPPTCPVRSLQAWLSAAEIDDGPLFRPVNRHGRVAASRLSDRAVALVVKHAVELAGLDPAGYAGHSLRAGLATSAAAAGASERSIMNQTGHRSVTTVRRYIRTGTLFHDNAVSTVDL